jgi:hypothetical protein
MATPHALDQLRVFRVALHRAFTTWADAFFELTDATRCATGLVHSVPTLSLEPEFSRSHGSLYKSLAEGQVDADALR